MGEKRQKNVVSFFYLRHYVEPRDLSDEQEVEGRRAERLRTPRGAQHYLRQLQYFSL